MINKKDINLENGEMKMSNIEFGTFGYFCHDECVYIYRVWWCWGRVETDGRVSEGTGRDRKEEWETDVAENV